MDPFVIAAPILDAAGILIDLRIDYANQAALARAGDPARDIVGRTLTELLPEEARCAVLEKLAAALSSDSPIQLDAHPIGPRPERSAPVWVDIRAFRLDGHLAVTWRDVSDRERAEQALRQSEELFRTAVDAMTDGLGILVPVIGGCGVEGCVCDFRFRYVNAASGVMNALPVERMVGASVLDLYPSSERSGVLQDLRAVLADGVPRSRELWASTASGRLGWFELHMARFGEGVVVVVHETTERRAAEQALSGSEALFHAAVDSIPEAMTIYDAELRIRYVNARGRELSGRPLEDFLGRREQEVWPESVWSHYLPHLEQAAATLTRQSFDMTLTLPSGRQYRQAVSYVPVLDERGVLTRVVGVTFDVTDRARLEEQLRRRAEELETVMAVTPVAIWVANDPACDDIRGNPTADAFYEARDGDNVSANVTGVRRFYRDGRELAPSELPMQEAAARNVDVPNAQLDVLLPSGEWLAMWGSARPLRDTDGSVRGCVGAFVDITELKTTTEALWALTAELEQRVEARTVELSERAEQLARLAAQLTTAEHRERRRLAQVLHDNLQQLVVAAKLQLSVLSRGVHTPEEASIVAELRRLMEETYEVSQSVTTDLSPPVLHRGRLSEALDWLVRWVGEKHRIEVELVLSEATDRVREEVKILVFEAARELLLNVAKHSGVRRARLETSERGADVLAVTVSDEGRGFGPEAFATRDRLTGGFGLLSIRERVTLLGGAIEIGGAPGRGARLTIVIPCEPAPSAEASRSGSTVAGGALAADAGRSIRVLIADDHAVVRQGIASLIGAESDIEIVGEAGDGRAALEAARHLLPDVVLMDCSMPVMDGIEATRALRAELPDIRIIGLSMYQEPGVSAAMIEAGAATYVTKSGSPDALIAAIRTVGRPSPGVASCSM